MTEYHKIQSIFKRDMSKRGAMILGEYSVPEFEYLKNNQWVFTEKVDGTNVRVMWDGASVAFNGKTDNAEMPVSLMTKLQELFEGTAKRQLFKEKFGEMEIVIDAPARPVQVCLYGEGCGQKIQKGGENYCATGNDFVLFDVKVGEWWLQRDAVEDIASHFGVKVAPIIGRGTLAEAVEMTRPGFKSQWGDFISEGIVLRPATELRTRSGQRIITKIKHVDFKNVA